MMRSGTTKSKGRKQSEDKFYTSSSVAQACIDYLRIDDYDVIIEPSAGNGAFSSLLPADKTLAFDIAPESDSIVQQDWFEYVKTAKNNKTLVIGNPPFGVQNNLAIAFFNHAANEVEASTIAFILPLSFKKESVQNKLNLYYHLAQEWVVPKNSFLLNGQAYHVPCVFQVWEKQDVERKIEKHNLPQNISYVKDAAQATISFQRVGGNAGKITSYGQEIIQKSIQSHYFLKIDESEDRRIEIIKALEEAEWETRSNTVGPRSISKNELNKKISQIASSV